MTVTPVHCPDHFGAECALCGGTDLVFQTDDVAALFTYDGHHCACGLPVDIAVPTERWWACDECEGREGA